MSRTARTELEDTIIHELPHLAGKAARSLAEILERLIGAYEPERICLFGSKARGDQGRDSDFDLLVVVADSAPEEQNRSRLAYECQWDAGTAGDIVVWTRGRFEGRTHLRGFLSGTVLREGRLLYAA